MIKVFVKAKAVSFFTKIEVIKLATGSVSRKKKEKTKVKLLIFIIHQTCNQYDRQEP